MERWATDLRFSLRALMRRPGFTVIAVSMLALGIGANTLIFSVVHGVLLRPLPYDNSDRIGILWHTFGDGAQDLPAVHVLDVLDYRDRSELFEDFTVATGREWILGEDDAPEVVDAGFVEAGFFEFFGATPLLGRTITPEDDVPGAAPVVLLSHRLWVRRFGSDPDIVGQTIPLAGNQMLVVGVLPESFRLELPGEAFLLNDPELWVSMRLDRERLPPRNFTGYTGFGRLRPGVNFTQGQTEIEALAARLREEHPEHASSRLEARVVPLLDDVVKEAHRTLVILLGAVALVLLIACANVANLVLARSQTRTSELALRRALGAGRGSVIRLLLSESVILSAAGLLLGLLLAQGGLTLLASLGANSVPRLEGATLNAPVLLFSSGVTILSAGLFGLLPALRVAGGREAGQLRGASVAGATRSARRMTNALVVAEVAASLVLLFATGLLIRTFSAIAEVDPGYDLEEVLTLRTNLPIGRFADNESRVALQDQLLARIRALPGVEGAAVVSQLPLTGSGPLQPYAWNEETARNWESVTADQRFVSPSFFDVMGARLISGDTFTGDPETDGFTIVVDDLLAERAFPGMDAVGQLLQINPNGTPEEFLKARIVGVVEHLRLHDIARPGLPGIWFPMRGSARFSLAIRSSNPAALIAPVRAILGELAPGAPIEEVVTMETRAGETLVTLRLLLGLMTGFGVSALLLASLGIYGVLSQAVIRRSREIGVRMALGQAPAEVRREVVMEGGRLIALALLMGAPVAVGMGMAARSVLVGVAPTDPATLITASMILTAVALVACWVPARRATRVDPAASLRE